MAKIFTLANQKGGVGKTTTTMNVAYSLASIGKKILVVDFDSQANFTKCMGIVKDDIKYSIATLMDMEIEDEEPPKKEDVVINKYGVDIIPSTLALSGIEAKLNQSTIFAEKTLSGIVERYRSDYDYIMIDTNPSLGILTINALAATDSIVIPMNTEAMAEDGLQDLLKTIKKVKKRINEKLEIEGILLTMTEPWKNLYKGVTAELREACGDAIYIFKTEIPRSSKVGEANGERKPIGEFMKKSPIAEAYNEFAKELAERNEEAQA